MTERRVLSLWQPWATLCVEPDPFRPDGYGRSMPAKRFETRHFDPRFPLPVDVAIHATKRDTELTTQRDFVETLARLGFYHGKPKKNTTNLRSLPFGAIIGVGRLVATYDAAELVRLWRQKLTEMPAAAHAAVEREINFGNYAPGRRAWQLLHVRPLKTPIPFMGKQDVLYVLSEDINIQIDRQLT